MNKEIQEALDFLYSTLGYNQNDKRFITIEKALEQAAKFPTVEELEYLEECKREKGDADYPEITIPFSEYEFYQDLISKVKTPEPSADNDWRKTRGILKPYVKTEKDRVMTLMAEALKDIVDSVAITDSAELCQTSDFDYARKALTEFDKLGGA